MTHDNTNLILSDGTEKLTFLDTTTFKVVKTISVQDKNGAVDKVNELIEGKPLADLSLEQLIVKTWKQPDEQPVFNNAAQIWNHNFYWHCLAPRGGGEPGGAVKVAIANSFGDFKTFKEEFSTAAVASATMRRAASLAIRASAVSRAS